MKASAMPEVKFRKTREKQTDAQIIERLQADNHRLVEQVDNLRELCDEQRQRIADLESQLAQAIKTGGVPF